MKNIPLSIDILSQPEEEQILKLVENMKESVDRLGKKLDKILNKTWPKYEPPRTLARNSERTSGIT